VSDALHPLGIFIVGLGGAFLIPLVSLLGCKSLAAAFVLALGAMTVISGVSLGRLVQGAAPIDILTGGANPPYAINLRMGLPEAVFAFGVNLVALIGAGTFVRGTYGAMLLCLLLVTGIQGMVMTRDLFNLFVFLEIVSIATYGLLSLQHTPAALSAALKYLMGTVLASTFFLIGTMLLYAATGMLNIDDLIAARETIAGPIGFAALTFLLACLLLELKPFPANGWGLRWRSSRSPPACCNGFRSSAPFSTSWSEACSSITCSPRSGCSGWRAMSAESACPTGRCSPDSRVQSCCSASCSRRSQGFHRSRASGPSGSWS